MIISFLKTLVKNILFLLGLAITVNTLSILGFGETIQVIGFFIYVVVMSGISCYMKNKGK